MDSNNTNQHAGNRTDIRNTFTREVVPILYILICAVGLVLNALAARIFFSIQSSSSLVVYLKNMVVADLLMVLTFPWRTASNLGFGGWQLRVVVCRYTAVAFYFSMYVGIVFLGLISLERYMKIVCSPTMPSFLQSVRFAQTLSALTWGLLMLFLLPNSVLTNQKSTEETSRNCMLLKSPLGVKWHQISVFLNISIFWVVFLLLAFCYTSIACRVYQSYRQVRRDSSEARKKSNRSIFSILMVFFICFVPYHICRIPYTLCQTSGVDCSKSSLYLLSQLKVGTLLLSAINVCLDPIIYFLMCKTFRESLMRKFAKVQIEEARRSLNTAPSASNV